MLADESQNFPLTYHWRVLASTEEKDLLDEEEWEKYVTYWGGSSSIGERVRANHNASADVVLFIEYFPGTLHEWLAQQLTQGGDAIDRAVEMVERNLKETTAFINTKGMLHFDGHFRNILTDGEQLYFSDFGLATSSQFSLSEEETQFFQDHQNYDHCYVVGKLTSWIISRCFGKDRHDEVLEEYANGKIPLEVPETLTPYLSSIVKRYAAITLKMHTFFKKLIEESKETPYPKEELDRLWAESVSAS